MSEELRYKIDEAASSYRRINEGNRQKIWGPVLILIA
jgi:hypothetical protein